jgi:hypothetical protein
LLNGTNGWTIVVQAKAAEGQPQSKTFGVSRGLPLAASQFNQQVTKIQVDW